VNVQDELQAAVKDEDAAHPVASVWRPLLRDVINAFVQGDYALVRGLRSIAPVPAGTAYQVRASIAAYGETLADLPDEAWRTSVSQWMGTYWDVLVDLWTVEAGSSDLVLSARIFEVADGFRIEIDSVYVP
jgi:hypothetical protein